MSTPKVEPGSIADHVLIVGPPGAGRTVWAREQRLAPFLTADRMRCETDSEYLWRAAGLGEQWEERHTERSAEGIWRSAPFRAPHHTVSLRGLTGAVVDGWKLRPGELSLAHGGVMLLDEVSEFPRQVLAEVLAVAMSRQVTLRFDGGALVRIPARFRLIAGCDPCPCGWHGHARQTCRCTDAQLERYQARLAPLSKVCRRVPDGEWQEEAKALQAAYEAGVR